MVGDGSGPQLGDTSSPFRMRTLPLLTALVLAGALSACDRGGGGGAAGELADSNAKVSQTVAVGLSGGRSSFREARLLPTVPCTGGGSVDVTQSGTTYRMAFDDCYDVTGAFDVASTVSTSQSGVSVQSRFDGDLTVSGGCDIGYDAFRASTETDLSGSSTTLTYDGAITASCPSGTTACQFSGARFEIGADGSGAPTSLDEYCE